MDTQIIREYWIDVDSLRIKVVRKHVKHLYLRIYPPEGEVRVTVPQSMGERRMQRMVLERVPWIKKQQEKFQGRSGAHLPRFVTGEMHHYLGRQCALGVAYQPGRASVTLRAGHLMHLSVPPGVTIADKARVLESWYRHELKGILPGIVRKWEKITGLKVAEYRIKRMKTRWGTCNPQAKRIWLSLALIKHPMHCIEYVVLHEMVHFWERSHGKVFVRYMDQFMPQWRIYKAELNARGLINPSFKF